MLTVAQFTFKLLNFNILKLKLYTFQMINADANNLKSFNLSKRQKNCKYKSVNLSIIKKTLVLNLAKFTSYKRLFSYLYQLIIF